MSPNRRLAQEIKLKSPLQMFPSLSENISENEVKLQGGPLYISELEICISPTPSIATFWRAFCMDGVGDGEWGMTGTSAEGWGGLEL